MTERPLADLDEKSLLARIHAGDQAACAECIERHASDIYGLALRLMKNEADAEDVMQETFLSAFQAVDDFEGRASLKTWLYRITYNTAMMGHRSRAKAPDDSVEDRLEMAADGYPLPRQFYDWCCLPESSFESEEVRAKLEEAIRDLPETLRGVFLLRELEGLSTRETAETLDVSTDVVKTRLRRARLALREQLSAYFAAQQAPAAASQE